MGKEDNVGIKIKHINLLEKYNEKKNIPFHFNLIK